MASLERGAHLGPPINRDRLEDFWSFSRIYIYAFWVEAENLFSDDMADPLLEEFSDLFYKGYIFSFAFVGAVKGSMGP
jgi:hypothetical protein